MMVRSRSLVDLSKTVSHALRHQPETYGVMPDPQGWVWLDDLVAGLRTLPRWAAVTVEDVTVMVATAPRRRHEVVDGQIRALHGHSLPGRVEILPQPPPAILYHGTPSTRAERILAMGIDPMSRQYVHLSSTSEQAVTVASRRSTRVTVIRVAASAAHLVGMAFRPTASGVWLTDHVPPRFLTVETPPWIGGTNA